MSSYQLQSEPYEGALKYHWSASFAFWGYVIAAVTAVIAIGLKGGVLSEDFNGDSNPVSGLGIAVAVMALVISIYCICVYVARAFDAVWGQSCEMLSVAILAAFICVLVIDAGFGWGKSAASSRQKADLAFDVFNFLGWIAICVFVIWEFNKHHVGRLRATGVSSQ